MNTDDSIVHQILVNAQHAHAQIESLMVGSVYRQEQLDGVRDEIAAQSGNEGQMIAIAIAIGAERDVWNGLGRALRAELELIGHLESLTGGANPG